MIKLFVLKPWSTSHFCFSFFQIFAERGRGGTDFFQRHVTRKVDKPSRWNIFPQRVEELQACQRIEAELFERAADKLFGDDVRVLASHEHPRNPRHEPLKLRVFRALL